MTIPSFARGEVYSSKFSFLKTVGCVSLFLSLSQSQKYSDYELCKGFWVWRMLIISRKESWILSTVLSPLKTSKIRVMMHNGGILIQSPKKFWLLYLSGWALVSKHIHQLVTACNTRSKCNSLYCQNMSRYHTMKWYSIYCYEA